MTKSRFDAVRRHRAALSEHAQQDHAEKIRLADAADASLAEWQTLVSETTAELSRRQALGIAPDEVEAFHRYLVEAAKELIRRRAVAQRLRVEAEASRAALVLARQDEQLIGQVDEARAARVRRDGHAREQRVLDETAVTRRARRG